MAKDLIDGDWGQPQFSVSGALETGIDEEIVSDYYAPMVPRRFTTLALLLAETPPSANYTAKADNVPGATFRWTGAAFTMMGTATFATAAARDAVLTAPAVGWRTRIDTESFDRQYLGSSWRPIPSVQAIVPTLVGTGGSSAVDASTGAVTFSGAVTVLDVYVPTALIALLSTAKHLDICFGYTGSTAGYFTMQLLDGAGAPNTATQYLADYGGTNGGVALFDARAIANAWSSIAAVATRKRHRYNMRLFNLAAALVTEAVGTLAANDLVAAARITAVLSLSHEVASAFTGIRFTFTTAGTITNGLFTMEAHY